MSKYIHIMISWFLPKCFGNIIELVMILISMLTYDARLLEYLKSYNNDVIIEETLQYYISMVKLVPYLLRQGDMHLIYSVQFSQFSMRLWQPRAAVKADAGASMARKTGFFPCQYKCVYSPKFFIRLSDNSICAMWSHFLSKSVRLKQN